ncbi:MAG: hypothetical protein GY940_21205 [bacterium]|nr:hypothetical protein [bacterium]
MELEYTPVRSPGAITAGTSASVSIGGQPLAEPGRTGIGGGAKSGHQTGMTQPTGTGIDMERLTGNVYRMLERRIRMERERRGW